MSITLSAGARLRVRQAALSVIRNRIKRDGVGPTAEALAVSGGAIRAWDKGGAVPSYTMVVRLAPILGIDPLTGKATS